MSHVGLDNSATLLEGAGVVIKSGEKETALDELPGYPRVRGDVESYQDGEFNARSVNYFGADGKRTSVEKTHDESRFARDKRFAHKKHEDPLDRLQLSRTQREKIVELPTEADASSSRGN